MTTEHIQVLLPLFSLSPSYTSICRVSPTFFQKGIVTLAVSRRKWKKSMEGLALSRRSSMGPMGPSNQCSLVSTRGLHYHIRHSATFHGLKPILHLRISGNVGPGSLLSDGMQAKGSCCWRNRTSAWTIPGKLCKFAAARWCSSLTSVYQHNRHIISLWWQGLSFGILYRKSSWIPGFQWPWANQKCLVHEGEASISSPVLTLSSDIDSTGKVLVVKAKAIHIIMNSLITKHIQECIQHFEQQARLKSAGVIPHMTFITEGTKYLQEAKAPPTLNLHIGEITKEEKQPTLAYPHHGAAPTLSLSRNPEAC